MHANTLRERSNDLDILADQNIPLVDEAFGRLGRVRAMPGRSMQAADVHSADVLLVRSVTPVGVPLLEGSAVQFVGSATIGTDHVDVSYLKERGIAFAHAPGANAGSVVEYVLAALLRLAVRRGELLQGRTIGIVGCGHIGGRLARVLPVLGLRVLKNDPPLQARAEALNQPHDFVPLARVLAEADILTLHVPLSREGPHATHHLIDEEALGAMSEDSWLLNTSRGAVVDNRALERALRRGHLGAVVLDVWEHEPTPDPALLRRVDLATPHIAGYSFDGKVQGTAMLYRALTQHLGVEASWHVERVLEPERPLQLTAPAGVGPHEFVIDALVRQMYDIAADDARLRPLLERDAEERAAYFSSLRRDYPRRRAFERYELPPEGLSDEVRVTLQELMRKV